MSQTANLTPQQGSRVSPEMIADAAAAGLELLDGEIAMSRAMRRRIGLLEMLLSQLAQGAATLVNTQQPPVQSPEEGTNDGEAEDEAPPKKRAARRAKK